MHVTKYFLDQSPVVQYGPALEYVADPLTWSPPNV